MHGYLTNRCAAIRVRSPRSANFEAFSGASPLAQGAITAA
jgi:hypothetical protein